MRRRIELRAQLVSAQIVVRGLEPSSRYENGLLVLGSNAGPKLDFPNPDQTGIVGVTEWVRSTYFALLSDWR